MLQLSNYLFFTTQCEEALAFYTACGLGTVKRVARYEDNGRSAPHESMRGKIMHAEFAGPGVHFYASDNDDAEPMRGFAMMFVIDSRAELDDLFRKLSHGGRVTTPVGVQPWGDYYGKLTDRFGVQWMLNCSARS